MPITLAHPAAVVPLVKLGRYASLSALIIGTMMPDMLNYGSRGVSLLDFHAARAMSHSLWPGAFLVVVIVGWPVWLFYQAVLKRPLAALCPGKVYMYTLGLPRFGPLSKARGAEFLLQLVVISLSLAVGAASHVIWDLFTHGGTIVGDYLPILNLQLAEIGGYRLHAYTLMQHGSSWLGFMLLAWWGWRWLKVQPELPANFVPPLTMGERVGIAGSLVFASCMVGTIQGLRRASGQFDLGWLEEFAGPAVVWTLLTWATLLALYAVIWSLAEWESRKSASSE